MGAALDYYRRDNGQLPGKPFEQYVELAEFDQKRLKPFRRKARQIRVLLAEDDPDTRLLLSHILENIGVEVSSVTDGDECLECALFAKSLGEQFDFILMDLQMPELDGYSAAGLLRLRGYEGTIIAITGCPIPEDQDEYLQAGCDYFVTKGEIHEKLPPLLFSSSAYY